MYPDLYTAALGALPTIVVAFVLEARVRHDPMRPVRRMRKIIGSVVIATSCVGFIFALAAIGTATPPPDLFRWIVVGCTAASMGGLAGTLVGTFIRPSQRRH